MDKMDKMNKMDKTDKMDQMDKLDEIFSHVWFWIVEMGNYFLLHL